MSMVAVFSLECCDRKIVFGRYKGNDEAAVMVDCPICKKERVTLRFFDYIDEKRFLPTIGTRFVIAESKVKELWPDGKA